MLQRKRIIADAKFFNHRLAGFGFGLVVLAGLLIWSNMPVSATGQTNISGEVLPYYVDNNVSAVVTNPISGGLVVSPNQTLEFLGNLVRSMTIRRGATVIATLNPVFGENQIFSQSVTLLPGLNSFTIDYVGGVPETSASLTYFLTYSPTGAGFDSVGSNTGSPSLSGQVSDPNLIVSVTIDGSVYNAINNGDGTWTLPSGVINPPLIDGLYDVTVDSTDQLGNPVTNFTFVDALEIDTRPPIVSFDTVFTDQRSPSLGGTIDEQPAIFELTINGKTYDLNYYGDGTWTLPSGSIIPDLASGEYDVVVRAVDSLGNETITNGKLTVKAANEIGFIIPPRTGYLRIAKLNIPSWIIYLTIITGLYLFLNRSHERSKPGSWS